MAGVRPLGRYMRQFRRLSAGPVIDKRGRPYLRPAFSVLTYETSRVKACLLNTSCCNALTDLTGRHWVKSMTNTALACIVMPCACSATLTFRKSAWQKHSTVSCALCGATAGPKITCKPICIAWRTTGSPTAGDANHCHSCRWKICTLTRVQSTLDGKNWDKAKSQDRVTKAGPKMSRPLATRMQESFGCFQ